MLNLFNERMRPRTVLARRQGCRTISFCALGAIALTAALTGRIAADPPCEGVQHWPCDSQWNAPLDYFGDVAIDRGWAVIGKRGDNEVEENAGALYVYRRTDGIWNGYYKIVHPDPQAQADEFLGESVAIHNTRVVGAAPGFNNNRGRLLVFDFDSQAGDWNNTLQYEVDTNISTPGDKLGGDATFRHCVAVSGDIIAGGAPRANLDPPSGCGAFEISEAGYVAVFIGQQEFVFTSHNFGLCPAFQGRFGASVVVDDDRLAIGEPGRNRVYLARYDNGTWVSEGALAPPSGGSGNFGWAVALDGATLAVGAPGAGTGQVHLYRIDNGSWNHVVTISHPDSSNGSFFGQAVALQGGYLLVGDSGYKGDGQTQTGGAFLMRRSGDGNWNLARTFIPDLTHLAQTQYGYSVALENDDAIIAAIRATLYDNQGQELVSTLGSAYFYRLLPTCEPYSPTCGGN